MDRQEIIESIITELDELVIKKVANFVNLYNLNYSEQFQIMGNLCFGLLLSLTIPFDRKYAFFKEQILKRLDDNAKDYFENETE